MTRHHPEFEAPERKWPKICPACRRSYREREFAELPPPVGGTTHACGFEWRNCHCGTTLVQPEDSVYAPRPSIGH